MDLHSFKNRLKKIAFIFAMSLFSIFAWPAVAHSMTLVTSTACENYSTGTKGDFKGEASLVYFYMGDSYLTTLAQETIDLSKPFSGADYKVLLYDQSGTATSKISAANAISQADEVYSPTQDNFMDAIHDIVDQGYVLNIWIISHGSYYEKSDGTEVAYFKSKGGYITSDEIKAEFGGDCELPIRMVYSGACFHSKMNSTWRELGAKVATGARYINFYPTQYTKFTTEWTGGKSFSTALNNSNTSSSRSVVQAYVQTLALGYYGKGDCDGWSLPDVLSKTDCAEWFFTGGGPYDMSDYYNDDWSGASNMTYSSQKIISGDKTITKKTTLDWDL